MRAYHSSYILFLLYSNWSAIPTPIAGAEDGAITIGNGEDLLDTKSFWYLGGKNTDAVKETFYFNTSEQIPVSPGPALIEESCGHCAINTRSKFDHEIDEDEVQIMVIGGNPSGSAWSSVTTYCKKFDETKDDMCPEGDLEEFKWTRFNDLNEDRNTSIHPQ